MSVVRCWLGGAHSWVQVLFVPLPEYQAQVVAGQSFQRCRSCGARTAWEVYQRRQETAVSRWIERGELPEVPGGE